MTIPKLFVLALAFAFTAPAMAVDLYSGVAEVPGQGDAERRAATPDALVNVLQKQSGRWDIPQDAALETALADPDAMLVAYQYREDRIPRPGGVTEDKLMLVASFVPGAVDRLVREMQLPRWRSQREPVVVWVVVEDGGSRQLMPIEYSDAWAAMKRIADLRGLPLAWPEMDEELRQSLDLQLLWGGYTDQLVADGAATDGIVIVAARREGRDWNVRWNWENGDTSAGWRTSSTDLGQALVEGTHQLVDHVAAANSIGPAGLVATQTGLRVTGLESADEYARVLDYLQKLGIIDNLRVSSAGADGVHFELALNADATYLEQALRTDAVLEPGTREGEYRLRRPGRSPLSPLRADGEPTGKSLPGALPPAEPGADS